MRIAMSRGRKPAALGERLDVSAADASAARAIRYLESSIVVAAILEADAEAKEAVRALGMRMTSALTLAETGRAIARARATNRISAQDAHAAVRSLNRLEQRVTVLDIGPGILARARRPFPVEPVRTLDAIHLATVEAIDESPALVTILTRDDRVRANAIAMGYQVE
jgi:predicted nucleic acid-binding protein